jgi:hypothetical protein
VLGHALDRLFLWEERLSDRGHVAFCVTAAALVYGPFLALAALAVWL